MDLSLEELEGLSGKNLEGGVDGIRVPFVYSCLGGSLSPASSPGPSLPALVQLLTGTTKGDSDIL